MRLSEILINTDGIIDWDCEITNITNDSRQVKEGTVFVCINGVKVDGHIYARAALQQGAVAVVCERDLGLREQVIVGDTHLAYGLMASNFYGNPSKKLKLIGVTGTKGKTTVTKLVKHILELTGAIVGLVGTIQNEIGDSMVPTDSTTPDAMALAAVYAKMVEAGCEYCVMEVSSHALAQHRIGDSWYQVAAFTNLTHEHLDYHADMEDYFQAKQRLFSLCDKAVVNIDDPYGKRVTEECGCECFTLSMEEPAQLSASDVHYHADSVDFSLFYQEIESRIHFPMPGKFSVYNALTAAGICLQMGISLEKIIAGLRSIPGVRGRNEIIPTQRDFTVICDYAHSPDSVKSILSALREVCKGRLVALVGCGGDRDRSKRPLMAKVAVENSDYVIITSDNPRTENPQSIIEEMLPGIQGSNVPYTVVVNRKEAIFFAIQNAQPGDTIVLCGKGHEDYQIMGTKKIHFDEREIVAEALQEI